MLGVWASECEKGSVHYESYKEHLGGDPVGVCKIQIVPIQRDQQHSNVCHQSTSLIVAHGDDLGQLFKQTGSMPRNAIGSFRLGTLAAYRKLKLWNSKWADSVDWCLGSTGD